MGELPALSEIPLSAGSGPPGSHVKEASSAACTRGTLRLALCGWAVPGLSKATRQKKDIRGPMSFFLTS